MTKPFGRKLDRGQGIFDFMGESSGNFAPSRIALCLNERSDIINDQHMPTALVAQTLDGRSSAKKLLSSPGPLKPNLQRPGLFIPVNVRTQGIHQLFYMRVRAR